MKTTASTSIAGLLFLALAPAPPAAAQAVLHQATGNQAWEYFGSSVAGAGDVDADGFADWIVGADAGDKYGPDHGYAQVLSGRTGEVLHLLTAPVGGQSRFGHTVAGLGGDADGDGSDDVLVSAFGVGRVYLFSGRTGAVLYTVVDAAGAGLGFDLAGGSDLDGDGVPDFVASAHAKRVEVFSGADGAPLLGIQGPAQSGFGEALDFAGDTDGDGVDDIIVGAPRDPTAGFDYGSARIYSGATGALLREFLGTMSNAEYGAAVAGLGDIDGDGLSDVAISAPDDNTAANRAGAVRVYSGASGALLFARFGADAIDRYGFALDGPGDVDLDGVPDLLIGAPFINVAGGGSGALHLVSGATRELILTQHDAPGDRLGFSVAGIGDANGDGVPDLVSGSPQFTAVAFDFNCGRAHLIDGSILPVAPFCTAAPNSTGVGAHIAQRGRTDVSANDFELRAGNLPDLAPCLFVMSLDARSTPFGDGFLCLGGSLRRLNPALAVNDHGNVWRQVDLTAPTPGLGPISPGDRWHFQLFYRDTAAAGAGFNMTDGLVATFGP